MMEIDLSGKIAVVTGGSGELGREMVHTLAKCGANVAIHYLKQANQAKRMMKEVQTMGVKAITVQADVTDAASVNQMAAVIRKEIGSPDIIVNNAVIQYDWKPVLEQGLEDYESQFRSCVLQNVLMAKAFIPAMQQKRWGRVIAINTECAMQNLEDQSAYTAGKRGMDGVLRVLAREVGEYGITVNQVAPGWTITENSSAGHNQEDASYIAAVPLRRRGTAREIANVVAFLASDLASFITGAYIPVSGGNVMPAI
jgi:3-oxoacyl-[acyl-carrier protein] reductase